MDDLSGVVHPVQDKPCRKGRSLTEKIRPEYVPSPNYGRQPACYRTMQNFIGVSNEAITVLQDFTSLPTQWLTFDLAVFCLWSCGIVLVQLLIQQQMESPSLVSVSGSG